MAKLQPWYHRPAPQCVAITLDKERCIYSARYEDANGRDIQLCKVHADMADFRVRQITPQPVVLR